MEDNKTTKNRVDDIDKCVANNLRTKRLMKGLSQQELGEAVNVSIQQIQKYEKGTNRISSSRLYTFANLLGVPVSFFFQGMDSDMSVFGEDDIDLYTHDDVSERELLTLIKAFNAVQDPMLRKRIVELIKCITDSNGLTSDNNPEDNGGYPKSDKIKGSEGFSDKSDKQTSFTVM